MPVLDTYPWRARLVPALLVLLPVLLALAAWFPAKFTGWETLVSILGFCGVTALLQQLARDAGRKIQGRLFVLWDGKPSTRALRHRHTHLAPQSLGRYHMKLGALVGVPPPSAAEELSDPVGADQVYESYGRYLLEHTRDRGKYRLVADENASYGLRRNLLGLKPFGTLCAVLGVAISAIPLIRQEFTPLPVPIASATLSVVLLTVWVFCITPGWVRAAGDAFAVALVGTTETLQVTLPHPTPLQKR